MTKRFLGQALVLALTAAPAFATIGGGDIHLANQGGAVLFSHAVHVDGVGQKCQDCHPKLFVNTKQHKTVNMKAMQKGASCGACHNGTKAFSVKGDCGKCHTK
jgi:c(7)-type cytochrome triheme protein